MNEPTLIDNAAWLAGYAAYEAGETCPWGDDSARLGWIAAKDAEHDAANRALIARMRPHAPKPDDDDCPRGCGELAHSGRCAE